MTAEAETMRRIPLEIFNEGRIDLIDELVAEDFVEHAAPPPLPPTRDSLHAFVAALRAAFPDFRYEILGQWQDGDTHTFHVQASGTMSGDFLGMPASGKAATWEEIHIARAADGVLVEHWAVVDQLGMLTQLGFVPPRPEPTL